MPYRKIHEKLKVPISTTEPMAKLEPTEDSVLKILADDYAVNPGLYMTREDLKEKLKDLGDDRLDEILKSLETRSLTKLYRDGKKTIALAKASYDGLRKAGSLEKYKWYPDWLSKDFIF
jgi:DNA-directed RNA polymerase sigma subunit (sigma70/sigma32)